MFLYLALESYAMGTCTPYSMILSGPKHQSFANVPKALEGDFKIILSQVCKTRFNLDVDINPQIRH